VSDPSRSELPPRLDARATAEASGPARPRWVIGPQSGWGLATAAAVCGVDQAVKLWLLFGYDLGGRGMVPIGPWLDLVLTWNTGISYGLFAQNTEAGRWLLLAFKLAAVAALWVWLARTGSRLTAVSLGLIIGGALGNAIDRVAHGAVADFVFFHVATPWGMFRWYVFNLADVAIVAGVLVLLYESFAPDRAAKAP
jgi:signal peptidase II